MSQVDPNSGQEIDPNTGLPYTDEQRAARDAERAKTDAENADKGDGPSSHETSGTFPADEVRSSHEEQDERNRQIAEQRAQQHAEQNPDQT